MKCKECSGTGKISESVLHPKNPNLDSWRTSVCADCKGRGELGEEEEVDHALDLITAVWGILDAVEGSEGWVYDLVDNGIKSWKIARKGR